MLNIQPEICILEVQTEEAKTVRQPSNRRIKGYCVKTASEERLKSKDERHKRLKTSYEMLQMLEKKSTFRKNLDLSIKMLGETRLLEIKHTCTQNCQANVFLKKKKKV